MSASEVCDTPFSKKTCSAASRMRLRVASASSLVRLTMERPGVINQWDGIIRSVSLAVAAQTRYACNW
ncbi:protein of unknown function [Burkholderia multivorans]